MSRSYADGEWPGLLGPVEEADRESRAGQGRLRSPPETRCRLRLVCERARKLREAGDIAYGIPVAASGSIGKHHWS